MALSQIRLPDAYRVACANRSPRGSCRFKGSAKVNDWSNLQALYLHPLSPVLSSCISQAVDVAQVSDTDVWPHRLSPEGEVLPHSVRFSPFWTTEVKPYELFLRDSSSEGSRLPWFKPEQSHSLKHFQYLRKIEFLILQAISSYLIF